MRLLLLRTTFLAAALLWAGGANAVPIEYAVEVDTEPGFAFSYIHGAPSRHTREQRCGIAGGGPGRRNCLSSLRTTFRRRTRHSQRARRSDRTGAFR